MQKVCWRKENFDTWTACLKLVTPKSTTHHPTFCLQYSVKGNRQEVQSNNYDQALCCSAGSSWLYVLLCSCPSITSFGMSSSTCSATPTPGKGFNSIFLFCFAKTIASATEIDGNCFVILPAKQVEERDGRFLKISSCSSSAIHTHFIDYIKLVHKTSRIFSKYNWSYPAFFLFVPCFCWCNWFLLFIVTD